MPTGIGTKAERDGCDILEVMPRDVTYHDVSAAMAVLTTRGANNRGEVDDMREVVAAIRPFFLGEDDAQRGVRDVGSCAAAREGTAAAALATALAEKSFPVIRPWFCDIGTKLLSH
jgi:hypothetical protein